MNIVHHEEAEEKKKSTDAVIEILLLYTPYCWIDIYKVYGFWHEYTHMKQHAPWSINIKEWGEEGAERAGSPLNQIVFVEKEWKPNAPITLSHTVETG